MARKKPSQKPSKGFTYELVLALTTPKGTKGNRWSGKTLAELQPLEPFIVLMVKYLLHPHESTTA